MLNQLTRFQIPRYATGKNSKNNYLDVNWGGGNEVPLAAIVIGNRSSNYQYPTNVEFDNVTVSAPEKNSTDQTYYLVYCYQNDTTNTVTIKGTLKRAEGAAAEFINSENNNGVNLTELEYQK